MRLDHLRVCSRVQSEISEVHSSGRRRKARHFHFLTQARPKQLCSSTCKIYSSVQCSSSTPTCFRDLRRFKSLRKNSDASLYSVYLLIWSWLSKCKSENASVDCNCEKISYVWSKKEENCRNLFTPNSFTLKDERSSAELKTAFSLGEAPLERWGAERLELVRFQQHLGLRTLTQYWVYDLYTPQRST